MDELHNEQAFADLDKTFEELIKAVDDVPAILQEGADAFVKDLKALPSPRSRINKSGHSHLLDTFTRKREGEDILIGWGKYYGLIVEGGSVKMRARPHFKTTWQKNSDRYYKLMQQKIIGGR